MSGIVQVKFLGRWGNQLHQYAAVRAYARSVGARFECPDWAGRRIFELNDPFPSCDLPEVSEDQLESGQTNIRLGGYFMRQRWMDLMHRAELRRWLSLRGEWLSLVPRVPVAAHIRRGDFVGLDGYCVVSRRSYEKAIYDLDWSLDHVMWVSDDSPRMPGALSLELSFLPDWLTLLRADILFRANSSFSWWAGVLGGHARVFSPVVDGLAGEHDVPFVEGNWPRIASMVDDLHLPE